jgi:hypothetical protein
MTAVASSALAAVAVLALVGVLILAFGRSGTPTEQDARARERAAEPRLTAVPEPAAVVTRPEPTSEPTSGPTGPSPTPTPSIPTATTVGGPGPGGIEVVVLNETKRVGLAAVFRDLLVQGGWTVKRIGDFRGNVPLTTVYYPPGFKAEAEALAARFTQVDRIRPAFPGAPKKRLTVILCKDYPA